MTDIKSRILEEAESAGINVIAVADAMEKCPTFAWLMYVVEKDYEEKSDD